MLKSCQLTWLAAHQDTKLPVLQGLLAAYHIKKWRVVEEIPVGEYCHDIKVNLKYVLYDKQYDKAITVRVLCEKEPYTPAKDGTWGINPVSLLKEI